MKKLGYLGLLLSYGLLIAGFFLRKRTDVSIALLVGGGVCLLLLSLLLVGRTVKGEWGTVQRRCGFEEWLRTVAMFPIVVLVGVPVTVIMLPFAMTNSFKNSFFRLTKPLRQKGFSYEKQRAEGTTVYQFRRDSTVIHIIPDISYRISFDGGKTFEDVETCRLGTDEERRHLALLFAKHNACDYRDWGLNEITPPFVRFLVRYL